ncbi:MAG: hemolysin family protein [Proteobacteria bacterium]|nr:hemolysin family protein [Pseudomonadota bacterium]
MDFQSLNTIEYLKVAGIVFLLLISGFFSGSEASLFSLNLVQKERLKSQSPKTASLIDMLINHPKQLIITILVGNDMINIAASVIATGLFVSRFQDMGQWVTIAVMTPVTLIFAEIIPKTIAVVHNEKLAPIVTGPLNAFYRFIFPLRWLFEITADSLIRLFGVYKKEKEPVIMEDDFRDMVDLSHKDGEILGLERDFIHNVFEFSDTRVNSVMTPIKKIESIPENLEFKEIIKRVKKNPHSRIPVYSGEKTNITGFLYVKDLLKIKRNQKDTNSVISELIRPPLFILDSRMVDDIFYFLKEKRTHIALCHDANGDISGLITMEDLLEELFGEIYDENDQEDR